MEKNFLLFNIHCNLLSFFLFTLLCYSENQVKEFQIILILILNTIIVMADESDLFACDLVSNQFIYINEIILNLKKPFFCHDDFLEVLLKISFKNGTNSTTNIFLTGKTGCQALSQRTSDNCRLIKR